MATSTNSDQALAFVNGQIQTMDANDSVANEVLVKNGRFVEVGNKVNRDGAKVIDLQGKTVIPGIVEAHVHVVSLANRPGYHTPIENTTSIAEIQETLAARRPDVPDGEFITALGGWHINQCKEHRLPTLKELDEAVPDRPVFILHYGDGPSAVNSLAKAFFEKASIPVEISDDGQITQGIQSTTALYHLRVKQTFADKERSTIDAMTYAASLGITAMLDETLMPSSGPLAPTQRLVNLDNFRMYDSWLSLHRQGKTFVRLQTNFLHHQDDPELPELRERLKNTFPFFGDDMVRTGGIGEWGAPGNGTGIAWENAQRLIAEAGWRNENSVGTLEALENVVKGYEKVNKEFDITGLRWMVHHVPFATKDLLDRLQAMGCGVQARAYWATGTAEANGAPFRMIVDHGIKTGFHGDGAHIAPLNPWPHVSYATTGFNALGDCINDGQQITRQETMRLFTRENSWFLRMEDRIGTIEPGKLADLAVLNKNYLTVSDAELSKVRSDMTVVGGQIVYESPI